MGRFEVQVLTGMILLGKVYDEHVFELAKNQYLPAINEDVTNILYDAQVFEHLEQNPKPMCTDCRREADNAIYDDDHIRV